jgi:hypothetical protein
MKSNLAKHKPADMTPEEFNRAWDNSGYILEPLALVLKEFISTRRALNEADFASGNVGSLAFKAGEAAMADKILDLLPSSAKSST